MKRVLSVTKLLIVISFIITPSFAVNIHKDNPALDKVYRTNRIADSYHFLLLSSDGFYYYVNTNKTKFLTAKELKSSSILDILEKKQSWGQAFASKGEYIEKNGKLYTKRYFDRINAEKPKTN